MSDKNHESPIMFLDYDKISDTLLYLSRNIVLKFNVILSTKDKFNHRKSFHRESVYESKYDNVKDAYNIRRDMNFYWTLEDIEDFGNGIMITIKDVFFFKMFMEKKILSWYIGESIYGISPDDGKLIITGKFQPERFIMNDYKYIEFIPIVLIYDDGKTTDYGVRMIINNPNHFSDIDLNRLIAMYQLICFTDMYSVACSMVNYVKIPPYGMNVFDVRAGGFVKETYFDNNRYGRSIVQKEKNFFDNL